MDTKQQIIAALRAFVNQRSGIEFGNYGDAKAFRAEQRSITKDRKEALELLRAIEWRDSITAQDILDAAKSAYSGRLTIDACTHGDAHKVTCGGNPKHVWCEACDPAPAALCHWCNGRGYSHAKPGAVRVDYCTGQYFPTEYRRAVAAVCATALWRHVADHCMPEPELMHNSETGETLHRYKGKRAGDWLRDHFRKEFGRGIASRWFQ
jgi:hypothetical protein